MAQITEPKKGEDVSDLWKIVGACVRMLNNFSNATVSRGQVDEFQITDGNIRLVLKESSGTSSGGGDGDGMGDCSTDRRGDNLYLNALFMPCGVADGAPTRVSLDVDDLASLGVPAGALPVRLQEVDCLYNGASGKQVVFASNPYPAPAGG